MKKFTLENIKNYLINLCKEFKVFVSNAVLLLKKNFKEVMAFTLICAILSLMFINSLKYIFIHLVINTNGVTYISPANLKGLLLSPICIVLIIVFFLFVTFVALFEISGLLHAYSMSRIGRDTNLYSMFVAGFRTCKKALHPKNWLIIVFILVLFPLADDKEADHMYRINLRNEKNGIAVLERSFDDVILQGEIEGLAFDKTNRQFLLLYNCGARIILGMPRGFYDGYTKEIHEVFIYNFK